MTAADEGVTDQASVTYVCDTTTVRRLDGVGGSDGSEGWAADSREEVEDSSICKIGRASCRERV